jgi:hypothetical protein
MSELDLNYHRFAENLGSRSLVEQWQRCIQLSSEPYAWLFSDDDVMDPECVGAFYAALEKTESKFDLYRFNTLEINAQGKVIKLYPPHPPVESVIEFAYHRLNRNRESFISEYIFARKAFDANGGMVKFPLAWCSDDASWITFAGDQGIYTIDGPKIYWRNSNVNISFAAPARREDKLEACGLYLAWLNQKFTSAAINKDLNIDSQIFLECQKNWLLRQIRNQAPLWLGTWLKISKEQKFSCLGSPLGRFISMVLIDFNFLFSRIFAMLSGKN